MLPRAGLFLLGVLAFASAVGNRPEALDDQRIVYGQAFLRDLSARSLFTCFSPTPAREEWLPLRDLTYMVDFAVHGARPAGLVLGNLLLHGAMVLAVHALARRVLAGRRGAEAAALAAAALFAVHPVHAESVAWISGRKDSLSGALIVLCVVVAIDALRARGEVRVRRLLLTYLLAAAALLSKASAVSLALLLPAADLLLGPARPLTHRALTWAPLVLGTALFARGYTGLLRAWGAAHGEAVIDAFPGDPLWTVLLTDAHVTRQYLQAVVVPVEARLFSAQPYKTAFDADVGLGLVVTLAALAGAVALARRSRALGFAAAWFFLALVPFLNLAPHGIPFAERYAHLASVGACVLAAVALQAVAGRVAPSRARPARALALLLAPLVLVGTWRCLRLGRAFETGETLWTHVLAREPENVVALTALGAWWDDRDPAEAERVTRRALALDPARPSAHSNLARLLERRGALDEALEHRVAAARAQPSNPGLLLGAASTLRALGRVDEALRLYDEVLARWPAAGARAAWNRALLLEEAGDAGGARAAWALYLTRYGRLPGEAEHAAAARARPSGR